MRGPGAGTGTGADTGAGTGADTDDVAGDRGGRTGAREPTVRRRGMRGGEPGSEIPGQGERRTGAEPSSSGAGHETLPDRDDHPLELHPELTTRRFPVPRAGGAPKDRAEHRAAIHRRFEELAECRDGSARHRVLRDELIAEHMNYARYVASRFSVPADNAEDLEQVAYLALIKAVDNFDPARGTAFLGYLTPMVTGEIKRYFRDATWDVHVPRRMQELSLALHGAPAEQLERRLGRSPTIAELAEHLGAAPEEIVEAFDASAAYSATSLERPLVPGDDQGASLGETLGEDDDAYQWVVDREALKPLLAALPERDKRILLMRFFRNMTQSQIGAELGVSQMQVSRYLARILGTLRDAVFEDDDAGRGGAGGSAGGGAGSSGTASGTASGNGSGAGGAAGAGGGGPDRSG
ncbi:SigB/SigF/SigG family RNA polymerase sigma factor [Catenulispora yoronensis]|uniref:SigB/SigF/SigG family RNA polymerase sigma factor n=1 Tax=Catenulispora yoronensis TaxID=450799 RepID=UPI0031D07670